MQLKVFLSPRKITKYLIIGVIFFTIVSTGIQVGKYVFDYREDWTTMFNLDRELNLPTWYSALMLGYCSLLFKAIFAGKKQQGDRYTKDWQLLSLILFWLAIDEVLSIHEILIIPEVSEALNLPWFLHSMWVIPGTIFVLWFSKRFAKFVRHLPFRARRQFIFAAVMYVGGALVMEMIGSHIAEAQGQQNLTYALIATLEEVMEMTGIIMLIYALHDYLRQWIDSLNLEITIVDDSN